MDARPHPGHTSLRPIRTDPKSLFAPLERITSVTNTPVWSACPMSAVSRPMPILPNSNDERMLDVDDQALATLNSFNSNSRLSPVPQQEQPIQTWSLGHGASPTLNQPTLLSPFSATSEGRRHTLASPSQVGRLHSDLLSPVSPYAADFGGRRRSAPSNVAVFKHAHTRRPSPEPGTHQIVPKQLNRPSSPVELTCGSELWWPVQPNGEVKVHVGITSRAGMAEKLTRCFDPKQLRKATSHSSADVQMPKPESSRSCPAPGTVLPVPGSTPQTPLSAMSLGRRFSICSSLSPTSPRSSISGRRGSCNEFPAEYISTCF